MESGPGIEVAAGLIFREERLLLTQRLEGDHLAGLWEFPGGKRERGESFEACLRRELREELGVDTIVENLIASVTHAYPDRQVHLRFYRCRLERGEPSPLGCAALEWVTAAELDRFAFPPADAELVARLLQETALWADGVAPVRAPVRGTNQGQSPSSSLSPPVLPL